MLKFDRNLSTFIRGSRVKGYIMRRLKQYLERDYVRRKASAVYQSRVDATVEACVRQYPSIALLSLCIKLFRTPRLRERGMRAAPQPTTHLHHYHHHPGYRGINPSSSSGARLSLSLVPWFGDVSQNLYQKGEGGGGLRSSRRCESREKAPLTAGERERRRKALQEDGGDFKNAEPRHISLQTNNF